MKVNNHIKRVTLIFLFACVAIFVCLSIFFVTPFNTWQEVPLALLFAVVLIFSIEFTDFVLVVLTSLFTGIALSKLGTAFYKHDFGTARMHSLLFVYGKVKLVEEIDKVLEK